MGQDTQIPNARKVMRVSSGACSYEGILMGYGVPSVPVIVNLSSVATNNWTSTWTIPLGCRAIRISKRSLTNSFKISTDSGTTYITISGADAFELDGMFGPEDPTILYFQTVTASDTIEIMYWVDGQECT